jgi:RNA polymerase sigma-70 factor (family 1)
VKDVKNSGIDFKSGQVDNSKTVYQQFHEIFARYGDGLYYYVLKLTGDETTAKDIVQECFLRLWENIQTIDTDADLLPLLVTYIKNLLTDDFRKKQSRSRLHFSIAQRMEGMTGEPEGEQMLFLRDRQQQLLNTLSQMPEKRRKVFQLVRQEGLSHKEVAEQLNLTIADVKKQMRLSMQLLRQVMPLIIAFLHICRLIIFIPLIYSILPKC